MDYSEIEDAESQTLFYLIEDWNSGRIYKTRGLMYCPKCTHQHEQSVEFVGTKNPNRWIFQTRCPCGRPNTLIAHFKPGTFRVFHMPIESGKPRRDQTRRKNFLAIPIMGTNPGEPLDRASQIISLVNAGLHHTGWPLALITSSFGKAIRQARSLPEPGQSPGFCVLPDGVLPNRGSCLLYLAYRWLPAGIYGLNKSFFATYKDLLLLYGIDQGNKRLVIGEMEWGGPPEGDERDQPIFEFALWLAGMPQKYISWDDPKSPIFMGQDFEDGQPLEVR